MLRSKLPNFLEYVGVNLCELGLDNDFLDMTSKAQSEKKKKETLDIIKIKSFCASEDPVLTGGNKMKRQSTEWGKLFANHISGNGHISRIYKEFWGLIIK